MKAREMFSEYLNIHRLIQISIQIADIYSRIGQYDEAEQLTLRSLKAVYQFDIKNDFNNIYENIFTNYIRSHQYNKIISLENEVINTMNPDHRFYFCLSFAYYQVQQFDKAKEYIKLAKKGKHKKTPFMNTMISAFDVYLSNKITIKKANY